MLLKRSETQPCLHGKQRRHPPQFPLYSVSQGQVPRWGFDLLPGADVPWSRCKGPWEWGLNTVMVLGWGMDGALLTLWAPRVHTDQSELQVATLVLKIFISKPWQWAFQAIKPLSKCLPVLELDEVWSLRSWKEAMSPQTMLLSRLIKLQPGSTIQRLDNSSLWLASNSLIPQPLLGYSVWLIFVVAAPSPYCFTTKWPWGHMKMVSWTLKSPLRRRQSHTEASHWGDWIFFFKAKLLPDNLNHPFDRFYWDVPKNVRIAPSGCLVSFLRALPFLLLLVSFAHFQDSRAPFNPYLFEYLLTKLFYFCFLNTRKG